MLDAVTTLPEPRRHGASSSETSPSRTVRRAAPASRAERARGLRRFVRRAASRPGARRGRQEAPRAEQRREWRSQREREPMRARGRGGTPRALLDVERCALLTFNSAEVVGLCLPDSEAWDLGRSRSAFGASVALAKPIGSRETCYSDRIGVGHGYERCDDACDGRNDAGHGGRNGLGRRHSSAGTPRPWRCERSFNRDRAA